MLAFDVAPLVHELSPAAGVTSTVFQVANSSDQPLTLEMQTRELEVSDSGAFAGQNADDRLLVFPPLVVLEPGAVQSVRVQLDTIALPVQDESYLVVVEQLPLNINETDANGVQVLLSFNIVVHISALDSVVDMSASIVDSASPLSLPSQQASVKSKRSSLGSVHEQDKTKHDDTVERTVNVRLTNHGSANAFGSLLEVILSSGSERVVFSAEELQAVSNDLFFPPMHSRVISLVLPEALWDKPLKSSVSYNSNSL